MCPQLLSQGHARTMYTNGGGVLGDAKFVGHYSKGPALEHDAPERIRVVWTELTQVRKHAVACELIVGSGFRHLDERSFERDAPPQMVDYETPRDLEEPSAPSLRVAQLLGTRDRLHCCLLQEVLSAGSRANSPAQKRQQLSTMVGQQRGYEFGCGALHGASDLRRSCWYSDTRSLADTCRRRRIDT
jgi:hypothetical protein